MNIAKSTKFLTLAALIALSPAISWTAPWYQKWCDTVKQRVSGIPPVVGLVAAGTAGCVALAGVIYWAAFDHRSDEQVIVDSQHLINGTHHKYDHMVKQLAAANLSSYTQLNEQLLSQLVDRGVDSYYLYYLNQTIKKINSEANTLSDRIIRSKQPSLSARIKIVQADLQQLGQFIAPLQQVLDYHASYMQLYRTMTELRKTYGYVCTIKTSQKKLVQHVIEHGSSFASYPYFDYVEKLEKVAQRLKTEMAYASYAENSQLYNAARDLYEALLIVKGTLASCAEYREDVQKRERARIKMQQEQERLAREIAQQQYEDSIRRQQEEVRVERERLKREQERYRQQQEEARKREQLEWERQQQEQQQRAQAEAYQRHIQQEQERQAWYAQQAQAAAADEWYRQQSYQATNSYPSAPAFDEPDVSPNQIPEPTVPLLDQNQQSADYSDADLDAAFATMNNNLAFETNETEQFQKDFGH